MRMSHARKTWSYPHFQLAGRIFESLYDRSRDGLQVGVRDVRWLELKLDEQRPGLILLLGGRPINGDKNQQLFECCEMREGMNHPDRVQFMI